MTSKTSHDELSAAKSEQPAQGSLFSSAPWTSSSGTTSTQIAAIAITPTHPATARSSAGGVAPVRPSSGGATSTEGSAAPPQLSLRIEVNTPERLEMIRMRAMLRIPRPRTRGECLLEARPCPWVACRHHLLLEVVRESERPPKMRLNTPGLMRSGRRPGLAYGSAEGVVRRWIDDAVELLSVLDYTCSLDYVDDHGWYERSLARDVGVALGVSKQRVLVEVNDAHQHARAEADQRGIDTGYEDEESHG